MRFNPKADISRGRVSDAGRGGGGGGGGMRLPLPGGSGEIVMIRCRLVGGPPPTLNCSDTPILRADRVSRLRVDHVYSITLGAQTAFRWELLGAGMTQSSSCTAPACSTLNVALPTAMPVRWAGTEDFTSLTDAGYSLFKEDSLRGLRFRSEVIEPGGVREVSSEVTFP